MANPLVHGRTLAATLLRLFLGVLIFPGASYLHAENIIIRTPKPYMKVVSNIRALNGKVIYQYKYVDAIAADVPSNAMDSLRSLVGSDRIVKYLIVPAPTFKPALRNAGASQVGDIISVPAGSATVIPDISALPEAAYDLNNLGLNIRDLHKRGKTGNGIVVAVLDSGIRPNYPVLDLDNSVIGGVDLVGDGLGFSNSQNEPHGTFVAGLISGNALFHLSNGSSLATSIGNHFPGALVGLDLPLVGTAPAASIYAVRIFGTDASGAPESRIIAAIDHIIDMRKSGLNIQVCNLSLGNTTLYAGRDIFDTAVDRLLENGIVPVVAAGDVGPSGLTVSSPATSLSAIAVGSASAAANERVQQDLDDFLGFGLLYRPSTHTQVAWFSSRGPNADGRVSPDVIAEGVGNFGQGYGSSSDITVGSGTSFSTPLVSGIAAVLRQAFPNATATQIRNAIAASGNPSIVAPVFGQLDQGKGFPDAGVAETLLKGTVPSVLTSVTPVQSVAANVKRGTGLNIHSGLATLPTGNLIPGQRAELLFNVSPNTSKVVITLSNLKKTSTCQPTQNGCGFFPDDIYMQVHSAKTSQIGAFGDYYDLGDPFVPIDSGSPSFTIQNPESGLMRITLTGSWTNTGSVSATITANSFNESAPKFTTQGQIPHHDTIVIPVTIPPGVSRADFQLRFRDDWSSYPTSDIDMILVAPDLTQNTDGAHLNDPEVATIFNPDPGTWLVGIIGFDVPATYDKFELRVTLDGKVIK